MNQRQSREITEQKDSGEGHRYIAFTLGGAVFAVDISSVQQIIRSAALTSIPNAPDYVAGLITLQGNIIPLIDLRKRLGIIDNKSASGDSIANCIIVLNIRGKLTGVMVDEATTVLEIHPHTIKAAKGTSSSIIDSRYIAGTCFIDETLITLPDFNRLFIIDER